MKFAVALSLLLLTACTSDSAPAALPSSVPTATAAPSPTPTSTALPTATPTPTPIPTQTPSPTAVPTLAAVAVPRNYRVLFARDKHLWSIDPDGKNLQQITPDDLPSGGFGWNPIPLSPDQRYVAVTGSGGSTWLLRLDGQDKRQVSGDYVYPGWSPDSRAITYAGAGSIVVRSLSDWQRPRVLASGAYGPCSFPTWSPDGRWIAFVSYQPLPNGQSGSLAQLWLSAPDGSRSQLLHEYNGGARDCSKFDIQWSSDGRYLLVAFSGLWRIQPPNNQRSDVRASNAHLSPFEPYLWLEDDIAVVDRILTLAEPIKERVEKVNRCDAGSLAFDRRRMACFPTSFSNNIYDPNTIQVIDIESGQTSKVKLSIQNRGALHWLPGTDFLIVETPTPSEFADLWLVNLNGSDPSLIAHGNFVAALSAQ